jgi:uncharacterized repeat protein (TIGR01451 family)
MRLFFFLILVLLFPQVYSLTFDINESQDISIEDSQVQISTQGTLLIQNISSEIFDIDIKSNNIFSINLQVNQSNLTQFNYSILTVIPLSYYNTFKNTGKTFLEYTTNFDIQTHRDVSLTKFDRDDNLTYSSRDIKINAKNPTNYTQKLFVNLIKTRPNQVNEFRNQLYLLTMYEIELQPYQNQEFIYKDILSEIGDSYFIDFSIEIIPEIKRTILRNEIFESTQSSGSSSSGTFNLLSKDLIIVKTVTPEIFTSGDILTITLRVSNPNTMSINNVKIEDLIPDNFILSDNQVLTSYSIIENFLPFETKEITYTLQYIGDNQNSISLPGTEISYDDKKYYTNPIILYPKLEEKQAQLLIEKVLTPLENLNTLVEIYITNIGNTTIDEFNLEDGSQSFYIPSLDSKEEFVITYETQEIDYSLPVISSDINVTNSIIINDKISITHNTKPGVATYSILLIMLAGVLLVSDIVL